jgi:hypothetical protein
MSGVLGIFMAFPYRTAGPPSRPIAARMMHACLSGLLAYCITDLRVFNGSVSVTPLSLTGLVDRT